MTDAERQTTAALMVCASARAHIETTNQLVQGSRDAVIASRELLLRTARQGQSPPLVTLD